MLDFGRFFGNAELDAWRDEHAFVAGKVLNELACSLINDLFSASGPITWDDAVLAPGRFVAERIDPPLRAAAEPVVDALVAAANADLAKIVEHRAVWCREARAPASEVGGDPATLRDISLAAAPIASGVAIAAALPTAAITTTGGLLGTGLFATTVVAWPVVALGGAAIGVALAAGALNATQLRGKAEHRLRRRVADHIAANLVRGAPSSPSVLDQLVRLLADTAREARKMR